MELADILVCPKSGNRLRFDNNDSVVRVEGCDTVYPVIDGVIDFCDPEPDRISASYNKIAHRYDAYITTSTLSMKIFNRIIWGTTEDYTSYMDTVLSNLPTEFDGILLDVPVGTGVFTSSLYARYPNATIIGVDSSMGMLQEAKNRFDKEGLKNIRLIRADATYLPVRDGVVDIVLFMNGLHVFPDKRGAIAEMGRVLRKQGTLVACGYVKGGSKRSDWIVRHFMTRTGYFNPPFFSLDDLAEQFVGFTIMRQGNLESCVYFVAVNEGQEK
ncbi:MAG: methyltransferase domain-containing protein [Planctomycetota bacterium]